MAWLYLYMGWAASLGPEPRLRIWGCAGLLILLYVFVDNVGREWMKDDPPDDDLSQSS